MVKNEAKLLGSWSLYYVEYKDWENMRRHIMNQEQYDVFFDWLNNDAKFLRIWDAYHFWSKVDTFGEITSKNFKDNDTTAFMNYWKDNANESQKAKVREEMSKLEEKGEVVTRADGCRLALKLFFK